VGALVAAGGDLEGAEGRVSVPPAPPILLASTSPQRRAILEQLRIPFDAVPPRYHEDDDSVRDPVALVREHAVGKARSVAPEGRLTLGVDTTVVLGETVFAKPRDREDAAHMLRELAGKEHFVVSALCLLGPGLERVEHERTKVTFRGLSQELLVGYLDSGEWEGRAGAYAIQGLGGRLVERVEGDYLNVVGLPGALLISLLEEHAPNVLETPR
jgi:nucleoside triphosphate pyrophosphatase